MLIELDDFKRALGLTDDTDEVLLYDIMKRAWNKAENYCNRDFDSSSATEYYAGSGEQTLQLDRYPVTVLGDLYIDSNRDFEAGDKIDSDDLYIDDRVPGQIRYKNGIFTSSEEQNVKVTYTAGYTATTMPEELKGAVIDLGVARYIRLKGSVNAVEGEDDRPRQLEKDAENVLDQYKRIR